MRPDLLANLTSTCLRRWVDLLSSRDPKPILVPEGDWDRALTREIEKTAAEEICEGISPLDGEMARSLQSGLLLWNDALTESHTASQQINTTTGSYWHGIMHRREPDFGNSKYWFHQVGNHPAFVPLGKVVIDLLRPLGDGYSQTWCSRLQSSGWDPFDFVDRCQHAYSDRESPEIIDLLEQVQLLEITTLLDWTAMQVG